MKRSNKGQTTEAGEKAAGLERDSSRGRTATGLSGSPPEGQRPVLLIY